MALKEELVMVDRQRRVSDESRRPKHHVQTQHHIKTRSHSALSGLIDALRVRPIFAGPFQRESSLSKALRKRPDPGAHGRRRWGPMMSHSSLQNAPAPMARQAAHRSSQVDLKRESAR